MARQFENPSPEDSAAAWDALLGVLDATADHRVFLWLATWARERARDEIVRVQEKLIRLEHFGYDEDAARARDYLASYEAAERVAAAVEAWIRLLVIERDVAAFFARMRPRGETRTSKPRALPGGKGDSR